MAQETKMTARQKEVVKLFKRRNPVTVAEAARICGCTPSNISQILRTMEKNGTFIRAPKVPVNDDMYV